MYPLIFLTLALIASFIHLSRVKKRAHTKVVEIVLMYLIFFNIGAQGVFAAMGHIFMANQIATEIGWPTGSPFQFEVGVANLGLGIAGLLALWFRKTYWMGVVIANTIFIYGAAYGHFVQMAKGDMSPYNSGVFLYVGDILIPTLTLILLVAYYLMTIRGKNNH